MNKDEKYQKVKEGVIAIDKLIKERKFEGTDKVVPYDLEGGSYLPNDWGKFIAATARKKWENMENYLPDIVSYFENQSAHKIQGHKEIVKKLKELEPIIKEPETPARRPKP
jgi:hypothetical protein